MAEKYVMINDIIKEHKDRMYNLRKYYPFFLLAENSFSQFKEGRYVGLDMGYIAMATLRFFIQENSLNEREVSYEDFAEFAKQLIARDFDVQVSEDDLEDLISYIFDKIRNDGKAFEFGFYDPEKKQHQVGRVKLIDSHIQDGQVLYFITAEGIEFYLDTKEIKDESKINVQQLLLEKMIVGENFKGAVEVVRRINTEVNRLVRQKEDIVNLLSVDVFKGAQEYEEYMKTVGKWFSEEQKLFAKNKALVDKAITKASYDNKSGGDSRLMDEISNLELELKRTIIRHGNLISSTMELQNISDNIIHKAKLQKLRPAFDFAGQLTKLIYQDRPDRMITILSPLFAPKIEKSFAVTSIDHMLTLRQEDSDKVSVEKKEKRDMDFMYEDEILDMQIAANFSKLFRELVDQLKKWGKLNLKEFNGILEIKFGREIYGNKDYYSFLTHLAQKDHYKVRDILEKPDTMLEGMLSKHGEECRKKQEQAEKIAAGLGEEKLSREMYAPDTSLENYSDMEFSLEFVQEEEIDVGEDMYVTNIIFTKC
jgi:hypothetical protein